jgi:hypothetical protein
MNRSLEVGEDSVYYGTNYYKCEYFTTMDDLRSYLKTIYSEKVLEKYFNPLPGGAFSEN